MKNSFDQLVEEALKTIDEIDVGRTFTDKEIRFGNALVPKDLNILELKNKKDRLNKEISKVDEQNQNLRENLKKLLN